MNIKSTKGKLLMSAVSLLVCMSMLVTSTFAWFTDTASSANNIIASGNLDVELYHSSASVTGWENVDAKDTLFRDAQGNPMLWEPGVVTYENFKIVNKGDLALKYRLAITTQNENYVIDPEDSSKHYGLSKALKVGIVVGGLSDEIVADRAKVVSAVKNWNELYFATGSALYESGNTPLLPATTTVSDTTEDEGTETKTTQPGTNEQVIGVVVYWEPSNNDNNFNLNNNKEMIAKDGKILTGTDREPLSIDLGIKLEATQAVHESDSFGSNYDEGAQLSELTGATRIATNISSDIIGEDDKLTAEVTIGQEGNGIHAIVSNGTKVTTSGQLVLTLDTTDRSDEIPMTNGQVSRSFDVHIDGIAEDNTEPIRIAMGSVLPTGLKIENIQLYHVEDGTPVLMTAVNSLDELTAHNQFFYDSAIGELTLSMATFSEVTVLINAGDPWNGKTDDAWFKECKAAGKFIIYDEEDFEAFRKVVGGMHGDKPYSFAKETVYLDADLDLGGSAGYMWYPVGYSLANGVCILHPFEGTFDGQGHVISNIYQNTWEIQGDYDGNYYNTGMGLFGLVQNGTIQNLKVNNFQSDGEFCTTGCVAARTSGNSTFSNITITNSNPRAYNVPNGGVVGYAYSEDGQTSKITFKNCEVGSSNKISALWGSWDVSCGGILGRVDDTTEINMDTCEVAAQIDVFNDVCGNYQYYQYRYAGMLIGTVGSDGDPAPEIKNNITVSNTDVYYNDWTDYYYCELVANSIASYTHDYQFSRLEKIDNLSEIKNGNTWTKAGNFLLIDGDKKTCYHIVKGTDGTLTQHKHEDAGEETVNGQTVWKEDKQIVSIPFKQLCTGYGWGATPYISGANVNEVAETAYTITYLDVNGYYIDEVHVSVAEADKGIDNLRAHSSADFDKWVKLDGTEVKKIEKGNRNDFVLYEAYADKYTVRFLDEDGNVIHTNSVIEGTKFSVVKTFDTNKPQSKHPDMTFSHWVVNDNDQYIKVTDNYAINADTAFYPYYTYTGGLGLTPHDTNGDGKIEYYTVEAVDKLSDPVRIPGSVNGVPVTTVTKLYKNDNNFDYGAGITKVVIGEGVETLEHNALSHTKNLSIVELPSTITTLGKNTFSRNFYGDLKTLTIVYNGPIADWQKVLANSDEKWDGGLEEGSIVQCTDGKYELTKVTGNLMFGTDKRTWTKVS